MLGDNAQVDCPKCWKYLIQKRVKVGVSTPNVPNNRTLHTAKPLVYTKSKDKNPAARKEGVVFEEELDEIEFDPQEGVNHLKHSKPMTFNEKKLIDEGVSPAKAKIFDLWMRGESCAAISERLECNENYCYRVLGKLKKKLLPIEYHHLHLQAFDIIRGLKDQGYEVEMNKWVKNRDEIKRKRKEDKEKVKEDAAEKRVIQKNNNIPRPQRAREMMGLREDVNPLEELPSHRKMAELMARRKEEE